VNALTIKRAALWLKFSIIELLACSCTGFGSSPIRNIRLNDNVLQNGSEKVLVLSIYNLNDSHLFLGSNVTRVSAQVLAY